MIYKTTGRKRYRILKSWFSSPKLVLQLEWMETNREYTSNGGGRVEIEPLPDRTYWEDAKVEHVSVFGEAF